MGFVWLAIATKQPPNTGLFGLISLNASHPLPWVPRSLTGCSISHSNLQPVHQIWSVQHPALTFTAWWDAASTAGRNYSILLLVWHQLIRSPWGSHVMPPRLSFPSCKIWIIMSFEVYPDPLIKDKDFKPLFLTAHSSGHELRPWHGKSSSTPPMLTLPQRENNKTLHRLIITGTGKTHAGCWYTLGFWQVCVLFLNTITNCFEFKELFSTA